MEDMAEIRLPPDLSHPGSFALKKLDSNGQTDEPKGSVERDSFLNASNTIDEESMKNSLRRRPWILYDVDDYDWDETECETPCKVTLSRDMASDVLEEAPAFHPTEEEFEDTLAFIEKIRPKAEPYGICRIVPPPSWLPSCVLKEKKNIWENMVFETQIQRVVGFQNHSGQSALAEEAKRITSSRLEAGVAEKVASSNKIGCSGTGYFEVNPGPKHTLASFKQHADDFKKKYFSKTYEAWREKNSSISGSRSSAPLVTDVEREYWFENSSAEIEVLYGDNPGTEILGSGFPLVLDSSSKSDSQRYMETGWNLTNMSKLSGSLLCLEDSKGYDVLMPRLHVGMCFSSQCWKVEKDRMYALSYLHLGTPVVWYGVPVQQNQNLEAALRKTFPDLSREEPDAYHEQVMILSPFALKAQKVHVYRCIQGPGEFVLVFPGLYYSLIDCGFNCNEMVNFAPLSWLPQGQIAVDLNCQKRTPSSIGYDKLILRAAKEALKGHWHSSLLRKNVAEERSLNEACGKDGILTKVIKARVARERNRRKYLWNPSKAQRMDKSFDSLNERRCCICFCDLYLSAAFCSCSPDKFSCPNHAKELCTCGWCKKTFLFRYSMDELNLLVEALEGKLSAIYKWCRQYLNFSLHSVSSNEFGPQEEKNQRTTTQSDGAKYGSIASIRAEMKARVRARLPTDKRQETFQINKVEEDISKDKEGETA